MSLQTLERSSYYPSEDDLRVERLVDHFPSMVDVVGEMDVRLVHLADNETGSFKWRGASNAVARLVEQGETEFWTQTAGNHGSGFAYALAVRGLRGKIFMPYGADQKREKILSLWSSYDRDPEDLEIMQLGNSYSETSRLVQGLNPSGAFVHPFDNPDVIEGQGSVVDDVLRVMPEVTHIVPPVGGGGLLAGISQRLDQLGSDAIPYGVQAPGSNSLSNTLSSGSMEVLPADRPNRSYGGLCVDMIGTEHVLPVIKKYLTSDNVVTAQDVDIRQLAASYGEFDLGEENYLEPSSLVAVAGLIELVNQKKLDPNNPNLHVAIMATGRNESPKKLLETSTKLSTDVIRAQVLR